MSPDKPLSELELVQEFSKKVWSNIVGTMTLSLCFLGDQLGLYRALAETGAVTSESLAAHTGLHERWLREWLQQQACAGLVAYEGNGRFYLLPEAIEVLAKEDSFFYAGGGFQTIMTLASNVPNLTSCFQTGLGLSYDALGVDCAVGLEQMSNPWHRQRLIPEILPMSIKPATFGFFWTTPWANRKASSRLPLPVTA
jgi:hypothetical protein